MATSSPTAAQGGIMEEDKVLHLPNDITYKILTQISDPASLVRAASSCKLWRKIIMDSTFLDGLKMRHRDHCFASSLLLGFFYQDNTGPSRHLWQRYKNKFRSLEPSFMASSVLLPSTSRKEGGHAARSLSLASFIEGFVASLNFYEPIASQDSFLVLRHRSKDASGSPTSDFLCVCNPLTGAVFHIPELASGPQPDNYALLVTDDVGLDGRTSQSFRLVAVWTTGNRLYYFYYCSKTRSWWKPSTSPEIMSGLFVVSSSASASHGGIHWLCGDLKIRMITRVVTLHVDREELSYLELPSKAKGKKLLSNSADGGLLLITLKDLQMSLWKHKSEPGSNASSWVLCETIDMTNYLPMRVLQLRAKVILEIFRGKSGAVVLWIEKEGLFLFSLSDCLVRKLDSERVTMKYGLCPYEMDWISGLAVTNLVNGSSSLDVTRKKVKGRWKKLVRKSTSSNLP